MTVTVTTAVVVSGDISDYTDSVRSALIAKVAMEANVPVSAVTLTVGAASVRLSFSIAVPTAQAASNASSALTVQLANPAAASAFLTTTSHTVTVEAIHSAPAITFAPSPPPPSSPLSPPAIASTSVN